MLKCSNISTAIGGCLCTVITCW